MVEGEGEGEGLEGWEGGGWRDGREGEDMQILRFEGFV